MLTLMRFTRAWILIITSVMLTNVGLCPSTFRCREKCINSVNAFIIDVY